mgnify:CR=1 FL=1
MSKKGGYQILDLKNLPLTSGTESNILGSYNAVGGANGKRVVVSGLCVAGDSDKFYNDFEMYFAKGENIYEGTITLGDEIIEIAIDNGDGVTVTVTEITEGE